MQVLQRAIIIYMQGVVCMVMMVYFLEMDGQMLDFISTLRHSCRPEYRHELTHKDNPKKKCTDSSAHPYNFRPMAHGTLSAYDRGPLRLVNAQVHLVLGTI